VRLTSIRSTLLTTSKEHGTGTLRALLLVSLTFFTVLTLAVYLILGMTSLLMALFPWAP
jgi:hypothetical protein